MQRAATLMGCTTVLVTSDSKGTVPRARMWMNVGVARMSVMMMPHVTTPTVHTHAPVMRGTEGMGGIAQVGVHEVRYIFWFLDAC